MAEIDGNHPSGAPCWTDIGVPDMDRAVDFYGLLFDWEFERGFELGEYALCVMRDRYVATIAKSWDPGIATVWSTYFAAADVDAAAKRITEAGGTVTMDPMDGADRGRLVLAEDPAGAPFGIWQGLELTGAQIIGEPGSLVRHELETPDVAGAAAFYQAVLERPIDAPDPADPGCRTLSVTGANVAVLRSGPDAVGRWSVDFGVADLDEAVRTALRAGGELRREAHGTRRGPRAVIADPFGAELGLTEVPA